MKKIILTLFVATSLFSCDPNEDKKVGNSPQFIVRGSGSSGSSSGTGTSSGTSDAPIDGGLSILLVAGAAYGVRRFRNNAEKKTK